MNFFHFFSRNKISDSMKFTPVLIWAVVGSQTTSIPTISHYTTPPPPNIVGVADELRNLTLHPYPHRNEVVTSCLVCGKSYDQVIEETVADYFNQTAHPVRQCGNDRSREMHSLMAFRAESSLLSPRECRRLPPVTAWSTPSITTGRTQSHRAMLCPYLKTSIIELSFNKPLDKNPHHFEVVFLYILIY